MPAFRLIDSLGFFADLACKLRRKILSPLIALFTFPTSCSPLNSRVSSSAVSTELDSRLRHGEHAADERAAGLVRAGGADEEVSDAEPAEAADGSVQLQHQQRGSAADGQTHRRRFVWE